MGLSSWHAPWAPTVPSTSVRAKPPQADADVVFETAGGDGLLERCRRRGRAGASIGLVGESFDDQTLDLASAMPRSSTFAIVWSYGSWGGRSEYRRALDLVAAGRVSLAPVVTHRFRLSSDSSTGLRHRTRPRQSGAVKVLVEP